MLSKKLTFSLTSLIVLLAVGLVFAPSVMADKDAKKTHFDLDVTIGAAESMMDVSAKDGLQIDSGRDRADRRLDLDGDGAQGLGDSEDAGDILTLSVTFSHPVNLEKPGASLQDIEEAKDADDPDTTKPAVRDSGGNFGTDDIYVAAFDMEGRQLGVLPLQSSQATIAADFIDASQPGRRFLVTVHQNALLNAYDNNFEIAKLVFFIPKGIGADPGDDSDAVVTRGIRKADLSHAIAHFGPGAHQHLNNPSKPDGGFVIELVDADEGDPQYAMLTGLSGAKDVTLIDTDTPANTTGNGIPGVVSLVREASRAGFIETGPFQVRIILTEEPMGGLTPDKIMVEGGTPTSVVKGVTYKGGHPAIDAADGSTTAVAVKARSKRDSQLGPGMISFYIEDADITNTTLDFPTRTGTPAVDFPATTDANDGIFRLPTAGTATNGTVPHFPQATGRDNMYHSYIATISPAPGRSTPVIVSVGRFEDNTLPVPKRYIPITPEQRDATRLTGWAKIVRDARILNESISVPVSADADTTSAKALATAAYKTRQDDIIAKNPNLKVIDKGLVIPANGYLVLVKGKDEDKSGVKNVSAKEDEKLTPAQQSYNIKYEFSLPFPADNLNDFLRNGGSISLGYADITAATDSGHDDAKASQDGKTDHKDYTGYVGAKTTAYAAGNVVINEIMWSYNTDGQYIELHNTTSAPIGIDNKEWVLAVGTPPAPFVTIDTFNNNPSTGYWAPKGHSGQSVKEADGSITEYDRVSMSRVMDATAAAPAADGSAEASWAPSIRRMGQFTNANLTGRSIGTPGAPNAYQMAPAPPPPTPPAPPAKADVATGSDIMISEIMVASNDGRLPQWIELANGSGKDVSLMGWSIDIDNDPADTDVVAESVNVEIGDVTVGKDQVVLVVTKTGRNSGVGTGIGDFRADRIVDVQSQVSAKDARYSLISEMAFKVALLPPQKGGVVERGDVVGNLGMGWELPMAESDRSSLIRREGKKGEILGTDAAGWVLASDTTLNGAYVNTYYGDDEDMGTPGYDAGGALPVELSKFTAKRDPLTGQVMITWETQSELNNAGFFIKRSQQKNAQFVAVNPTMIAGAGTTSEKQSYTYTDTTAQPNIVYYYQIEDVSLDGHRQTLTRAHRLKGHVGAAGKATTTWGELKTSRQ